MAEGRTPLGSDRGGRAVRFRNVTLSKAALASVRRTITGGIVQRCTKEIITMTNVGLLPQKSDIWWVFLLQGFAGIVLGLMLVTEPGATIVALTTVLGFYWLITGLLGLVQVFVDRSIPWIWSLLGGLVGILAGLFVLRHLLVAALTVPTVIVIILGIEGLVLGALQIIGGFKATVRMRRAAIMTSCSSRTASRIVITAMKPPPDRKLLHLAWWQGAAPDNLAAVASRRVQRVSIQRIRTNASCCSIR
jgi:uncharacterized membrane protein HdeD (DUF308 family)